MLPSSEARETFSQFTPEIIGTKFGELVTPCPSYPLSPKPPPPANGFPIAVALSGGGFRATLAGIGVLRFLADAGILDRLRHVSSVSGGSIASAMLAVHYQQLLERQFAPISAYHPSLLSQMPHWREWP